MSRIQSLPLWARKAAVDAIEGSVSALLVINFVIPGSFDEAKAQGVVAAAAVTSAVVAAARRALPAFIVWLRKVFAVDGDE